MNSTLIKISILATVLSIAFINPISATSAGVSPPKIILNNALPGNDYNLSFTVYNQGNQSTDYFVEAKGNISNWTYIEQKNVTVEANSNLPMKGIIKVPSNVPTGNYTGSILIKSIPDSNTTGNKVSVGVNLPIMLNISALPNISIELNDNVSTNNSQNKKTPGFELPLIFIVISLLTLIRKTTKNK